MYVLTSHSHTWIWARLQQTKCRFVCVHIWGDSYMCVHVYVYMYVYVYVCVCGLPVARHTVAGRREVDDSSLLGLWLSVTILFSSFTPFLCLTQPSTQLLTGCTEMSVYETQRERECVCLCVCVCVCVVLMSQDVVRVELPKKHPSLATSILNSHFECTTLTAEVHRETKHLRDE